MEECGELTQACSKVLRTRYEEHALEELRKEVADVMCMVELMKEECLISDYDISTGINKKKEKLKIWENQLKKIQKRATGKRRMGYHSMMAYPYRVKK